MSGATGALLGELIGGSGEQLGFTLAQGADLDGDGRRDLIVGAPLADLRRGEVRTFSTATLAVLMVARGRVDDDRFGENLGSLGDVSGDGFGDWLAMGRDPLRVELHSGTGELLAQFERWDLLGFAQPPAGPAVSPSGDAIPDLLMRRDAGGETILGLYRLHDLLLQVDPAQASYRDRVNAWTRGGRPGNAVALVLAEINGVPDGSLIDLGVFDASGAFRVWDDTPAGLAGTTWTLRSYAIGWNGKVATSLDQELEFR